MSETLHTPGPWEVDPTGDIGPWAVGNSQKLTADCRGDFDESDPELVANANLIAAAPELLETCKLALEPFTNPDVADERRARCRAAIAKAEGGGQP